MLARNSLATEATRVSNLVGIGGTTRKDYLKGGDDVNTPKVVASKAIFSDLQQGCACRRTGCTGLSLYVNIALVIQSEI